jgi:hypothetical protein
MTEKMKIRWVWLKIMYALSVVVDGGLGLVTIIAPNATISMMGITCAPVTYGIVGSVYLAFGLLSILGLLSPLKFVPVLLLQLTYKTLWLVGVALPLAIKGIFPAHDILMVVIFVIFVIGDLIAIPFRYVFPVAK